MGGPSRGRSRRIEERHGLAGALPSAGGCRGPYRGRSRRIEERHGLAGALPSDGGCGGLYRGPPLSTELMFDLKIEGATVIDGTGASVSRVDVGVSDETITAVGDLSRERAATTLN